MGMTATSRFAAIALLAACACNGESVAVADPPAPPTKVVGHYCHVAALTPAEWKHLEKDMVPRLVAATFAHEELPDGYAFRVHGTFKELGEWLDSVRRCCPSISYHLDLSPDLGDATLRIVGDKDAKSFIREEFKPILAAKS
jgi:hypothetical protein